MSAVTLIRDSGRCQSLEKTDLGPESLAGGSKYQQVIITTNIVGTLSWSTSDPTPLGLFGRQMAVDAVL